MVVIIIHILIQNMYLIILHSVFTPTWTTFIYNDPVSILTFIDPFTQIKSLADIKNNV
jgi:hypothetical protein